MSHLLDDCNECGGLLCVKIRERTTTPVSTIHETLPEPSPDVLRVVCAICGTTLWVK